MLILVNVAATTHTISIWLGVALAVFRFVQMRTTSSGNHDANWNKIDSEFSISVEFILIWLFLNSPSFPCSELLK
jgi:hypothetical protein